MPSFMIDIKNNQAFLLVDIGHPKNKQQTNNQEQKTYRALFDTGAQKTLISPKIVDDLGFVAIGQASLGTAAGDVKETTEHRINIAIPVRLGNDAILGVGRDLNVMLSPYQPKDFDVLLGMDVLVGYHITMFANQIVVSN